MVYIINTFQNKENKLKIILFFIIQILFFSTFAQDKKVIVSSKNGNTLFVNFPNLIELGYQGFCGEENNVQIICNDCDSIVSTGDYQYNVFSSKVGSTKLEFHMSNHKYDSSFLISQTWFYTLPLPDPNVMIGHYFSSQKVDLNNFRSKMFFAKYPPSISTVAVFSLEKWYVKIGDEIFIGDSPQFSDKLNKFLFEENHSDKFKMEVCLTINSPDRTQREICDVFTVEP